MTDSLSLDRVERLLPALRPLAEWVPSNGMPNREELQFLLLASGLDEHWAVSELERWAKVLAAVGRVREPGKRDMAVRALMLRGIPEAPAKLAVEMASRPGSAPAPLPPPLPLQVSREAIGFGGLKPGEGAQATLTVSGGPGRVRVGSDLVTVQPGTFGPHATTLLVTLHSGLEGQVLWDTLLLESETETATVDLTARWSLSVPSPTDDYVVPPDGTLEQVLLQMADGATIHLESEEYRLAQPLTIERSVRLQGMGMGQTKITCDGEAYVVQFVGNGFFAASDLTFEHIDRQWANVVEVSGGQVDLRRCRFIGGVWDEANGRGGDGIYMHGLTQGMVVACEFSDHERNGMELGEQAQPTLEGNTCQWNQHHGIVYFGTSGGLARQNNCLANDHHGISVGDQAQPTLEGNTCQWNRGHGIGYFGNAAGNACQNACQNNRMHGLGVGDQAQPTIEGNTCHANRQAGIGYFGNATGNACQNICQNNRMDGIGVNDQAQPMLQGNTCHGNQCSGIAYFDATAGISRQNTCNGNDNHGISVNDQAQPTLEGNTCQGNQWSGIAYLNTTAGITRQNTCNDNGDYGILVEEGANPQLDKNLCSGNKGEEVNDLRQR